MLLFSEAFLCSLPPGLLSVILYLKAELTELVDSYWPLTGIRTWDWVLNIQKSTATIFLVCLDVYKNNLMKLTLML